MRTEGTPPRDLLAQVFHVDVDAKGVGLGLVLRDVTAERELLRAKDELVAIVGHELRTPLAVILGLAELLLAHPDTPKTRCVEQIH